MSKNDCSAQLIISFNAFSRICANENSGEAYQGADVHHVLLFSFGFYNSAQHFHQ